MRHANVDRYGSPWGKPGSGPKSPHACEGWINDLDVGRSTRHCGPVAGGERRKRPRNSRWSGQSRRWPSCGWRHRSGPTSIGAAGQMSGTYPATARRVGASPARPDRTIALVEGRTVREVAADVAATTMDRRRLVDRCEEVAYLLMRRVGGRE